jgi:RNA polymerase sigma-70 factor (ECF subfamily)
MPSSVNRQREVVQAFLAAARTGDFQRLLAVLDPDGMFRADAAAMPSGKALAVSGAEAVAKQFRRPGSARGAQPALIDGGVGIVVAPRGRLMLVVAPTITDGKIVAIDAVAYPERLSQLEMSVLDD